MLNSATLCGFRCFGMSKVLIISGAEFVAGAAFSQGHLQISFQRRTAYADTWVGRQIDRWIRYVRVVRKVLVLSYEREDLLVSASTSAKVPRRGFAKVHISFSAKVLCNGGLLTGSWSEEPCVFAGSARRMTKVGRSMRSLRVAARIRRCKSRSQLLGVLKLGTS